MFVKENFCFYRERILSFYQYLKINLLFLHCVSLETTMFYLLNSLTITTRERARQLLSRPVPYGCRLSHIQLWLVVNREAYDESLCLVYWQRKIGTIKLNSDKDEKTIFVCRNALIDNRCKCPNHEGGRVRKIR